jgi:hypothetical protein
MGLDLAIIPIDYEAPGLTFASTRIETERRHELFEAMLAKLAGFRLISRGASFYAQDKYATHSKDAYGDPLRVANAAQLMDFAKHKGVTDNSKNIAAWAYIEARGGDFILYWH